MDITEAYTALLRSKVIGSSLPKKPKTKLHHINEVNHTSS